MSPNSLPASIECANCNKPLPKSEFMRCSSCKAAFDLVCINLSTQRFYSFYKLDKQRRDNWKCSKCPTKKPSKASTPRRLISDLSPESSNITVRDKTLTTKDIGSEGTPYESNSLKDDMSSTMDFKLLLEEMRAIRTEMSLFRSVITDLSSSIKSQNLRLDSLESRIDDLEAKTGESGSSVINKLEETIAQLKLDIEEKDQETLGNDIEVANFPEISNENSIHVMLTVAKKLGVELDERDIVSAQRVGAPRVSNPSAGGAARPRPIAVRLARRSQRDALLQAARVRRRLTTDDVNLPGTPIASRPFYVNERLTRANRQLFQRTREVAKRLGWTYVWTRDGKVFTRQENGKARHRVRTQADLVRVFGSNAVSDDAQSLAD
ncbi:hypothetical protein ABMA27_013232 [Loxostege sticticalis]|uniref:FP protein C-terminal domain-containing protein n=1 Tax=Loxostege sticticalis TaxID=481309 RepID=A0ABR3IEJ2_LOXSC